MNIFFHTYITDSTNMAENIFLTDHFLNLQGKPKIYQSESFYPVYIKITVNNIDKNLKSRINEHLKIYRSDLDRIIGEDKQLEKLILSGYLSKSLFDKLIVTKKFPVFNLLEDEKNVLNAILSTKVSYDNFSEKDLKHIDKEYKKYTLEISEIIDRKIKYRYREELHKIFLQSIDHEEDKKLFKIVNYLIHFINWENTFYNFYNNTFEIIPGGLKEIENLLSEDLNTIIKAYMALHTRINLIKRFLEKRELGKISVLSYLDWQSGVKEIVSKQFTQLFGREKGLEYINALDKVLMEEVVETLKKKNKI